MPLKQLENIYTVLQQWCQLFNGHSERSSERPLKICMYGLSQASMRNEWNMGCLSSLTLKFELCCRLIYTLLEYTGWIFGSAF